METKQRLLQAGFAIKSTLEKQAAECGTDPRPLPKPDERKVSRHSC